VIVADPVPEKLATLLLKVAILLLDVQLVELVTSVPLKVALNVACDPFANVVPLGVEEITSPCPLPVTLPVADPPMPFRVAVTDTPLATPTPFTVPRFTVAQGVELCHVAELVTSLLPLLYVAVAYSLTV